ncbi:MAG: glycoside hydrolase family 18 protein [Dehalococcoidales bacterium]|nr:glycoside hydrolase family 18 protein [Dehalococcoidales bacterium]
MRSRYFIVIASTLLLVGLAAGQLWPRGTSLGPLLNRDENGIWLDVVWVSREQSEDDITGLVHDLRAKGFRYAYVYVNSVQASGKPRSETYACARRFVDIAKQAEPELQLIAWIGVVNVARGQGLVDLGDTTVRANLAAFCGELVHDIGFDGVQLNVEPLPRGSESYLTLLKEVRGALGSQKTLAVAGHKWAPAYLPFLDQVSSYWDSQYYHQVGLLVDQVAMMAYDTYMPTALAYRLYVREETLGVLRALENTGTKVLIGIPTYDEPRLNHQPEAENVESGLTGVLDALARLGPAKRGDFAGVAIYPNWETDQAEWGIYARLWQGEPQPANP